MASDATVALARFEPSHDGKLLAYSLSDGGTDWEIWRFRRVDAGTDLPDELRRVKFWQMSWAADGSGVYYSRYPARTATATTRDAPPSTSIASASHRSATRSSTPSPTTPPARLRPT